MSRPARIAVLLAGLAFAGAALASGQLAGSARALEAAAVNPCAGQAWPHIDPACLVAAEGAPARSVRVIDDGAAAPAQVLVRLPASE
jgi:hypothetical protein